MLVLLCGPVITEDLFNFLDEVGIAALSLIALAGDVSQRRHFRIVLEDGKGLIATHYPESLRGSMARFVGARALLAAAAVRVPAVHHWSAERGWMLVEDLGSATLFEREELAEPVRAGYFLAAAEGAEKIARLDAGEVALLGSPPLDGPALRRELELTFEFLFDPRGLAALPGERREFSAACDELCLKLTEAALVPCHRDYMARNLLPHADGIAVIDFQDLRLGPQAYDLASLLNDSFFPEPGLEERLLPESSRSPSLREQYSRAVVQRTLKASGTFARFAAQGNPRHLPLMAPTLERAARHLAFLPETRGVFRFLRPWWTTELARATIC